MSSNTQTKKLKSASSASSVSSKSKTMKKESPKHIPTFSEIYEHKHIFPDEIRTILELINNQTIEDDDDNVIEDKRLLFYTEYTKGWEDLEEVMDDKTLLHIHKPLTKVYFKRIETKHKQYMTKLTNTYGIAAKKKHADYFRYSYRRFKMLKQLPKLFIKYMNAIHHTKRHLSQNTRIPKPIADMAIDFLLNDPEYQKMMKNA